MRVGLPARAAAAAAETMPIIKAAGLIAARNDTPVIVVASVDDTDIVWPALETRAVACLTKPVDAGALLCAVREALAGREFSPLAQKAVQHRLSEKACVTFRLCSYGGVSASTIAGVHGWIKINLGA